jgi:hypothetical protein
MALGALGCRSETTGASFGTATQLAFQVQPASTVAGQPVPVKLEIRDAQGRLVANATRPVRRALNANSPVSMAGMTTVNAVGGIATFSSLYIITPGVGYTFTASSPAVAPVTSQPFDIVAPAVASPRL